MSRNHLFMLEFAVQELIITKGNECAPPEYPLNAEFTFRTGVYVSIPEQDFGSFKDESVEEQCPRPTTPEICEQSNPSKSGQCCLFALEKPVRENENLMIHVYKKRTDKCKFLIGATEYKMKEMFDKVMEKYLAVNGEEKDHGARNTIIANNSNLSAGGARLSAGGPSEDFANHDAEVDEETQTEPVDPESSASKQGSLNKPPSRTSSARSKAKTDTGDAIHKHIAPPKRDVPVSEMKKMGMSLYSLEGKVTGSMVVLIRLSCMGRTVCTSIPYPDRPQQAGSSEDRPSPCPTTCPPKDRVCPEADDNRSNCSKSSGHSSSHENTITLESSCASFSEGKSEASLPVIKPKVDKSAYDEFEADLNGCGLAIRVLKDSHKVSSVRRFEIPSLHNNSYQPKADSKQKSAIFKLLELVCSVLQSVTTEPQPELNQSNHPLRSKNNKCPNMQQICQCIQSMLGAPGESPPLRNRTANNRLTNKAKCNESRKCNSGLMDCSQRNSRGESRRQKPKFKNDPCKSRCRGGSECDSQRNIMLVLESIRQVVSNKKGLSDLADLLLQCISENNGGGDSKSWLTTIYRMILEKIRDCADDRPLEKKQADICGLVRTLTELENTNPCPGQRGGQITNIYDNNPFQPSENISYLVKKILELGVKYCTNRNIDLRNVLCSILNDDVCNEQLTNICRTICQYLESDRNVISDHIRKEINGRVVNSSCIPQVRGTIKYPSTTDYGTASFTLPTPDDTKGVEQYRRKNALRECCVQIDGPDIDNTMKGVNKKLPAGLEICRKGTMDLDSDVFILKMGKKTATSEKKGLIEIELRTPKGPSGQRPQLASIASQVDEDMLKERVTSAVTANSDKQNEKDKTKDKGKGKGKGKSKGKGKK